LLSRPSVPLLTSTLTIVAIALLLPYAPFASKLGFVPLPPAYLGFLAAAVVVYLFLVELVKRPLVRSKLMDHGALGESS
jgi:Mg2+-importing ATPase